MPTYSSGLTPDELITDFVGEFQRRKFSAGLLLALIDLMRNLGVPDAPFDGKDAFFAAFELQTRTPTGGRANTLFVRRAESGAVVGLRPFYNTAERYFRAEQKRFDYPDCAPHATQAWVDYHHWIDALVRLDADQLQSVEDAVKDYVLQQLKSHEVDTSTLRPPQRWFARLLEEFNFSAPPKSNEPHGAAYQGMVYAYIRADAPHLHLEVAKVGAGSKRLQRVGDIDGWEGQHLILSAEVKHFHVAEDNLPDIAGYASEVTRRYAMGLVVADTFAEGVREQIRDMGLYPVGLADIVRIVELWDPLKQRMAFSAFTYYAAHVEKRMPLIERINAFFESIATEGEE